MENFRRQFTLEAVETLDDLSKNLQKSKTIDNSLKLEIFRTLHTIKGTAQTFGFAEASHLAHELENLISADKDFQAILIEGLGFLKKSLTENDFDFPDKFVEKIRAVVPSNGETFNNSDGLTFDVPKEIFSQLSTQEKKALRSAIRGGKSLICFEVGFELANFADELINFREVLTESGEIIATFPSSKFGNDGKIGFQVLLASDEQHLPSVESFGAEIVFQTAANVFNGSVSGVLEHVAKHGMEIARKLNKQIKFKIYTDKTELSAQKLKLIFDVLLHLVRNSVDHGIENEGEIEIDFSIEENGFRLSVADDGRGIEPEKIKQQALERNLISGDVVLTEKETLDLIFSPEFSTKSSVTEISGRGIGLDAVKKSVENAGGKITLSSQPKKGATFDIFLPH